MQKRKNGGKQFIVVHKQIREMKKKKTSQFIKSSTRNNVDKVGYIRI